MVRRYDLAQCAVGSEVSVTSECLGEEGETEPRASGPYLVRVHVHEPPHVACRKGLVVTILLLQCLALHDHLALLQGRLPF